jgi:uncharacterized phage-associated protein
MIIPFDVHKVIQASAVLLKEHEGRMSRLRLLKLLYIADRESISQTLRPITGDRVVAMDHGPVLSRTYGLIRREHLQSPLWDQFIAQEGPQGHRLAADPGVGKLSRSEIERLVDVSARHRHMNDYDIAMETHQFAEWTKNRPPQGSSQPIPLDDILEALGLFQLKSKIEIEAQADAEVDRLLNSAAQP